MEKDQGRVYHGRRKLPGTGGAVWRAAADALGPCKAGAVGCPTGKAPGQDRHEGVPGGGEKRGTEAGAAVLRGGQADADPGAGLGRQVFLRACAGDGRQGAAGAGQGRTGQNDGDGERQGIPGAGGCDAGHGGDCAKCL